MGEVLLHPPVFERNADEVVFPDVFVFVVLSDDVVVFVREVDGFFELLLSCTSVFIRFPRLISSANNIFYFVFGGGRSYCCEV